MDTRITPYPCTFVSTAVSPQQVYTACFVLTLNSYLSAYELQLALFTIIIVFVVAVF